MSTGTPHTTRLDSPTDRFPAPGKHRPGREGVTPFADLAAKLGAPSPRPRRTTTYKAGVTSTQQFMARVRGGAA